MAKSVDGFRPVKPLEPVSHDAERPLKQGHGSRPQPAVRSMDGMVIRQPRRLPIPEKVEEAWEARPRIGFDTPKFIDDPVVKGKAHTKASKFRKTLALLQYPLAAILAVVAVYSTSIGQWLLLAYAIYAVVRRVESKATFIGALLLLIAIPLFQLLKQPGVAENIAVYTYELLVVGTIQAIIELIVIRKNKKSML